MKNEKGTIVLAGGVIGLIAAILVFFGNPANMGFCIACFLRDTTGALGLHSAAAVQYIRPEIIGLVLGACIISLVKKEFRPRGGSAPVTRFTLGAFVMIGCLMFLGCPFRMILRLAGGDPNGLNKSVEELIETVKEVADAVDVPLVVEGCKNVEKDSELLTKVAEVLQGRNVLVMSAREEDYKAVGAAAGLAYNQKVGAESAVDINLAKQLNVVMTQLGVSADSIVMNVGSAAVGYGYEYVVSTLDRIKAAALSQDDKMLQMPIITPIASETWNVKEAMATEEESPEWGNQEVRGVSMEIQTAAASLASGSDAVILKHPQSVATISKMIQELM